MKLFRPLNLERAVDPCDVVALRHISMDSLTHLGARPRLELFFVKSFYCSELKNFSAPSLHFYFMASFLH